MFTTEFWFNSGSVKSYTLLCACYFNTSFSTRYCFFGLFKKSSSQNYRKSLNIIQFVQTWQVDYYLGKYTISSSLFVNNCWRVFEVRRCFFFASFRILQNTKLFFSKFLFVKLQFTSLRLHTFALTLNNFEVFFSPFPSFWK